MIQSINPPAPRQDQPPYQAGQPVALFIPCYIDQFFPSIGRSTVALLERYGVPVVFPDRQTCCGQPAFNSGYWEEARRVIRHFCKAMEGQQVDRVPVRIVRGHVPGVFRTRRSQRRKWSISAAGCSN